MPKPKTKTPPAGEDATPAPATKPRPKAAKKPAVDWPAALRSGPVGVRRWNRLTAAGRRAVNLSGADLGGLDLAEIDLREARAAKASFAGATLARVRLSNAQLGGSNLAGADLGGADLAGADLRGADLSGATLAGAILDRAEFDRATTWPAGFVPPAEMRWAGRGSDPRFSGRGGKAVAVDINGLMTRLIPLIDPKRLKRTLDMLKAGRNQIFSEVTPTHVRGIVRSQTDEDKVYSCVLTEEGVYTCCSRDLTPCMGLSNEPCKHLLALLIGLARAGEIDVATVDRWVVAASGKNPRWNKTTKNHVSETLLRYQGVQAGEVDWRPTETIPEDFYAI